MATAKTAASTRACCITTEVASPGSFLPFEEQADDVEEITIDGQAVPFVVRLEIGTINRHIYIIALLRGPNDTHETPDLRYWNRKLLYQLRGGVGIGRRQGRINPNYIPSRRSVELQQGYAVVHSTANQTSTSYDIELAEDTMARVKRHFTARYGEPIYTIGLGKIRWRDSTVPDRPESPRAAGWRYRHVLVSGHGDANNPGHGLRNCWSTTSMSPTPTTTSGKKWSQRSWVEGFNARDDLPNFFEKMRALQALSLGQMAQLVEWSNGMHAELAQSDTAGGKSALHLLRVTVRARR